MVRVQKLIESDFIITNFDFKIGISEVILTAILAGMFETRIRLQKIITEFCIHKDKKKE